MTGYEEMPGKKFSMQGVVKSMGLVFGDIGTSPIYALTAIFLLIPPHRKMSWGSSP